MKPSKFIRIILTVFFLTGACKSDSYNYTIEDYKLTLVLAKNNTDVKASIELTYLIEAGESKSDGFKFVGTSQVDSLICTDETGIINSKIEYLKETKLLWHFAPVSSGLKKVRVDFILRDFAINEGDKLTIDAPWAKVFRVPVRNAKFQVDFPVDPATIEFMKPEQWDTDKKGVNACYYSWPAPSDKSLKLQYTY